MPLRCLDSNIPLFLSSSPLHLLLLNDPFPSGIAHCSPFPSLPTYPPFQSRDFNPRGKQGNRSRGRDPGVPLCSAAASCPQKPPRLPRSFYILTAVWDRQGLTSLQADTHPVPSEITWTHQRPPQPPPLGPRPRSRHSPLQTARRIRPLLTRLSMARRVSSVIPTKGMHRRAAEKAGTEGPKEGH